MKVQVLFGDVVVVVVVVVRVRDIDGGVVGRKDDNLCCGPFFVFVKKYGVT